MHRGNQSAVVRYVCSSVWGARIRVRGNKKGCGRGGSGRRVCFVENAQCVGV